jgi:hypothetical protein
VGDPSAERVARNDHTFRAANDRIRTAADEHGFPDTIPFLCECPDETCTEIVRLTREQYTSIRGDRRRFVNAPGHTREDLGHERIVERADGFEVIEKVGEAGELSERLAE